jgi:hypothetical protein
MNATITEPDTELDEYVAAVGAALADLPDTARTELLEDLASHLREYDRNAGSLRDQLGDPVAYATELRASAGFATPAEPRDGARPTWLERRSAELVGAVTTHPWWRATVEFLPELRPAWWVARAWAVVAVLSGDASLVPALSGSRFWGFLALVVLIPLSVRHGRRARRRRPTRSAIVLVASAAAAVALLGVVASIASGDGATYGSTVVYEGDGGPPTLDGDRVASVSMLPVFDRDGLRLVRHDYVEELSDGTVVVSVAGERRRAMWCADGSQRLCLVPGGAPATTVSVPIVTVPPATPPSTTNPSTTTPFPSVTAGAAPAAAIPTSTILAGPPTTAATG